MERKNLLDYLDKMPEYCDGGIDCLNVGCIHAPFRQFCKKKFSKRFIKLLNIIKKTSEYNKDLNRVSIIKHCKAIDYNFEEKVKNLNPKELKLFRQILQLDENIHFHYDKDEPEYLACVQDNAKLFELTQIDDIIFE
jgi:hypothetical protein